MFSSRGFIVSGITFGSLIHVEFIFVYGIKKCSSLILLEVVYQVSQHHLLKSLIVFSPLYFLASFVKDKVSIGAWIYHWSNESRVAICIEEYEWKREKTLCIRMA